MRKALAMILTLVMLMSCLAGCGNNNEQTTTAAQTQAQTEAKTEAQTENSGGAAEATGESGEAEWFGTEDGKTITLKFWGGVQPEYGYDQLVANFNEEYKDKGVQVEYTRYVNDSQGNLQLETYLMGGGEVDMFMGYGGMSTLSNRAESGLILDMSEILEEEGFDLVEELGASSMAGYTFEDGSVYGFPTKYENVRWLLINVDMFEAAGVPIPYDGWTYSEFLDAVEKLTYGEGQDKVYGVSWTLKQSTNGLTSIMNSVLGTYATYKNDEATELNYDHDVWRQGWNMLKTTLDNGWAISIEDEYAENMTVANTFLAGKCAISTNVSQMRLCMDTTTYPHDFVTALVPGPVPDGDEYNTEFYRTHAGTSGAGDLFCIAASTEYPEACFEFAMWYVQGGMAPLAKGGRIPLWSGLDKEEVISVLMENANGSIDLDSMRKYLAIDTTQGVPGINNEISLAISGQMGTVFSEEFQALCYGKQTVDETIANLMSRGSALIESVK